MRSNMYRQRVARVAIIVAIVLAWLASPALAGLGRATAVSLSSATGSEPASLAFPAGSTSGAWQQVALPGQHVTWIAVAPANPDLVYAAVDGHGVSASSDGGLSWNPLPASGLSNLSMQAVAVCPSGALLAGTWGGGIFLSIRAGRGWQPTLAWARPT